MADSTFNSAYFFENATYEEMQENVYHVRRKAVNEDFLIFLNANLKELEFIKKRKQSWEYTFEQDKQKKIRVIEEKNGIHVVAMHKNEKNKDVNEEVVERDSGETFEKNGIHVVAMHKNEKKKDVNEEVVERDS